MVKRSLDDHEHRLKEGDVKPAARVDMKVEMLQWFLTIIDLIVFCVLIGC